MESDFIASYVSLNRPVLIKGGAMHLEAMSWSDYRHLLMDMGSEVVQAAPVPYSKNMGLLGAMEAPLSLGTSWQVFFWQMYIHTV